MNTRIMAVALVVSLVAAHTALAEEVELVRVVPLGVSPADTSWANSARTIIVIGPPVEQTATFPNGCSAVGGSTYEGVETVVVALGSGAVHMTMYEFTVVGLSPGDRVSAITADTSLCCTKPELAVPASCSDPEATDRVRKITGTLQQPSSAGSALFSSPVELDSDSIGVVTGQPNDDGTHTVVFKKQGSPAVQVDIATDDELLAADVLRDLIDLGCDEETGEHLYLAEIEW